MKTNPHKNLIGNEAPDPPKKPYAKDEDKKLQTIVSILKINFHRLFFILHLSSSIYFYCWANMVECGVQV